MIAPDSSPPAGPLVPVLCCLSCGRVLCHPLADLPDLLRDDWPECCGQEMGCYAGDEESRAYGHEPEPGG